MTFCIMTLIVDVVLLYPSVTINSIMLNFVVLNVIALKETYDLG